MNVVLYSVFDKLAEEFGPIFEAVNEKVAIRAYTGIIGKTEYPGDYELYEVGKYDRKGGLLEGLERPVIVPVALIDETVVSLREVKEELENEQH